MESLGEASDSARVLGLGRRLWLRALRGLAEVAQGTVLRDHLTNRLDIGARGVMRQVRLADRLGLAVFPFQRQHQSEVAAYACVGFWTRGGLSQRLFGLRQL